MSGGDGFASAFRLLDPSSFDWPPAGGSPLGWTAAERARWGDGLRLAADVADRYAELHPEGGGAFRAFAVTLRTRADMGPEGPPRAAAVPTTPTDSQEHP